MSDNSQLILRRLIIYLQDVNHILYHEILTKEEIQTLETQLKECFKWFAEIKHRLDEQKDLQKQYATSPKK